MRWLVMIAVIVILSLCLAPLGVHAASGHDQHAPAASCGSCLAPPPSLEMIVVLVLLGAWLTWGGLSVPPEPARDYFRPPKR